MREVSPTDEASRAGCRRLGEVVLPCVAAEESQIRHKLVASGAVVVGTAKQGIWQNPFTGTFQRCSGTLSASGVARNSEKLDTDNKKASGSSGGVVDDKTTSERAFLGNEYG